MILDDKVKLSIGSKCVKYYTSKGYNCKFKDIIEVKVEDLLIYSTVIILVKCDVDGCGNIKELSYSKYNKNINNGGYYACSRKCSHAKIIKTNIENYGTEYATQCDEVKAKSIVTNLLKYGTKYTFQAETVKNKIAETNMINLGVKNAFESEVIKEQIKKNNLEKHGFEFYSQTEECKEKSRKTCLEKYDKEYYMQTEEYAERAKNTRIENGNQIPDSEKTNFQLYETKVLNITYKYKKELFDSWDGFDHYDNEFILYNYMLEHSCGDYPTIDHKISIHRGFKDNISPEEIGNINNLCYTKRWRNSDKHTSIESEYIEKINNKIT